MTNPNVAIVAGNPKSQSRTLAAAQEVAARVVDAVGWPADIDTTTIDLGQMPFEVFDWGSQRVEQALLQLRTASLAVVASPVYKASYSGLLKAFLDRVGQGELHDVVVVPLMVGAAPHHALAIEAHLRPLLVELGAVLPTRGLFVLESELEELDEVVEGWLHSERHAFRLRRALGSDAP
jgi:FMN reductase